MLFPNDLVKPICRLPAIGLIFFMAVDAPGSPPRFEYRTVAGQTPPEGFSAFEFPGHDADAELLTRYLWYHFHHRLGNDITLFNKEYLAIADLWLNNAIDRRRNLSIQDIFREFMLTAFMDDEGYVSSHQHISHAHDLGWPFPIWVQAHSGPDEVMGRAIGWHFQADFTHHWVGNYLRAWNRPDFSGETAVQSFTLENLESLGIVDDCWHLRAIAPSPRLTTPEGMRIRAHDAPFLQLRWRRAGDINPAAPPYVEWMGEDDADFSTARRMFFYPQDTPLSSGFRHSHIAMFRHPEWRGTIKALRLNLAPGEDGINIEIDSFFTAYDTRHTINNPILILGSYHYFNWTRDLAFLRANVNRMRTALKYQQTEMGGLEHNHIRVTWPGHDGGPGWTKNEDGSKTIHSGTAMGNNYWDLLPFGWDDFYATMQYYAATLAMADIEQAVRDHPQWDIPRGVLALDPEMLRAHARDVRRVANEKFWNHEAGRFYPSITRRGERYDFGFTFLNLESIWYGIAREEHAQSIMEWIRGERIVEGDTSTGEDLYRWRFGPRATTRRNVEWYKFVWTHPEHIPWGGQVQDGGAVLGFTFYDLWARLHYVGPDDAWERLGDILAWQRDVDEAGGYRAYYGETDRGTTLQGGGTAGGIGIDFEFFESSLLPAIVPLGFLGLRATPGGLTISPKMPAACPEMTARDVLYAGTRLDLTAGNTAIAVHVKDTPLPDLRLRLDEAWSSTDRERRRGLFVIREPGVYHFRRVGGAGLDE